MSGIPSGYPAQPCPCGENSDHSCKTEGSQVDTALTPSPRERSLQPGTMRNWFVGLLFATGALLFVNQGHSRKEDWALNLAGVLAIGIALFPMPWDCYHHSFSPHGFCAVSFFVCIAFVSAICSRDSLELIKDPKVRTRYRKNILSPSLLLWSFRRSPRTSSTSLHRNEVRCIGQSYLESMPLLATGASKPKKCPGRTFSGFLLKKAS